MRIGIVSDIHGNWTALREVDRCLRELQVDLILGAGDYLWTTTGDRTVVDWLLAQPYGHFVRGNGDSMAYYEKFGSWAHEDPLPIYEAVSALPDRVVLDLAGYRVLLQHEPWPGVTGAELCARLMPPPYVSPEVDLYGIDIAIFGDTHLPLHHATPETLIIHPGSVGAPFDADPTLAKFAILDLGPDEVRLQHMAVPFDIAAANREILQGRKRDVGQSYYRKMTESRLMVASPNGEHWEPVPAPVTWRPVRTSRFAR